MTRFLRIAAFAFSAMLAAPVIAQEMTVNQEADLFLGALAYDDGDYSTAVEYFAPLAAQGFPRAQTVIGHMYDEGLGFTQNYNKAAYWHLKAAKQGHPRSIGRLGFMYAKGEGVLQSYVTAHMWANIASSAGDAAALELRSILESAMTREQVADAQARARLCMSSNYQDCD